MKGSRIHGIVRELKNENIDVVNHTENIQLLITRALSPAKINSVELDDVNMKAAIYMDRSSFISNWKRRPQYKFSW